MWGSNSRRQDQESHALPTEPVRCLYSFLFHSEKALNLEPGKQGCSPSCMTYFWVHLGHVPGISGSQWFICKMGSLLSSAWPPRVGVDVVRQPCVAAGREQW